MDVNIGTAFGGWGVVPRKPRFEICFHTIHRIDTVRAVLGGPTSVFGLWGRPARSRIPDAFLGPVGSPRHTIARVGWAETSARNNVATLCIMEALYRSGDASQAVALGTISSEAHQ